MLAFLRVTGWLAAANDKAAARECQTVGSTCPVCPVNRQSQSNNLTRHGNKGAGLASVGVPGGPYYFNLVVSTSGNP